MNQNCALWTGSETTDYIWKECCAKENPKDRRDNERVRRLYAKILKRVRKEAERYGDNGASGPQKRYRYHANSVKEITYKYLNTWDGNKTGTYVLDVLMDTGFDPKLRGYMYTDLMKRLRTTAVLNNQYTGSGKRYLYNPDTVIRTTKEYISSKT